MSSRHSACGRTTGAIEQVVREPWHCVGTVKPVLVKDFFPLPCAQLVEFMILAIQVDHVDGLPQSTRTWRKPVSIHDDNLIDCESSSAKVNACVNLLLYNCALTFVSCQWFSDQRSQDFLRHKGKDYHPVFHDLDRFIFVSDCLIRIILPIHALMHQDSLHQWVNPCLCRCRILLIGEHSW